MEELAFNLERTEWEAAADEGRRLLQNIEPPFPTQLMYDDDTQFYDGSQQTIHDEEGQRAAFEERTVAAQIRFLQRKNNGKAAVDKKSIFERSMTAGTGSGSTNEEATRPSSIEPFPTQVMEHDDDTQFFDEPQQPIHQEEGQRAAAEGGQRAAAASSSCNKIMKAAVERAGTKNRAMQGAVKKAVVDKKATVVRSKTTGTGSGSTSEEAKQPSSYKFGKLKLSNRPIEIDSD